MRRPPLPLLIAGFVTAVLVAFAGGYGPHRDELYFVAAGKRLDWAYADQGALTPLLARVMTELSGSLTVLRIPSAIAAGLVVWLTALLARELGGGRRAEVIAAAVAAVSSIVLFTGHLLSTATFDLLAWTAVTWLAVRAVRTGDGPLWLWAGMALGLGLMNKPLPAFLAFGLLAGVLIAGPRRLLRDRWVWAGALVALAVWSPWLVWQASEGWPQLDVAESVASGASTSAEPWFLMVPFQVLLVSPPLAPVWIAGLVRLLRSAELRFLAWTWLVLAVVFMATGGKPYYLAGLLPVLVGAGAIAVDGWLDRGAAVRRWLLAGAVGLSGVIGAVIALPLLPESGAEPVLAVNEDVGETIGWPAFARTVAQATPPGAVIFTRNYGQAGAIDRYGPALGLPRAFSGHNAYGEWGPPPDRPAPVVVVGFSAAAAAEHFAGCRVAARIDTGVDNEEDGGPVLVCDGPRRPWSRLWPALRHLG